MTTRTVTFPIPDGDYCEDRPAPGTRCVCRMSGTENNHPYCCAYDVRLEEKMIVSPKGVRMHTLKCEECLEGK